MYLDGLKFQTWSRYIHHRHRKVSFSRSHEQKIHNPELDQTANSVLTPPYEMQQLLGRGFGLLANRSIQRGEPM